MVAFEMAGLQIMESIINDNVSVSPPISERVDANTTRTLRRPRRQFLNDLEIPVFHWNTSVGFVVPEIGRDLSLFERQNGFSDLGKARTTLQMANVRLDTTYE